ncbi:MAG: NAD-dependent epimerase/dehydratase family protein [Pseudomonadales bacterium]|nr:NAD-dependent epimerase/dehydratase family protein [Candidatus Woesebacteria bacterium]MCB9802193.1 NAD-dependent epimerase/dehydratase family protein [Pseudomonadales bacterium]
MSKRIIVTGGSGFLGKHLITRLLTEGHQVTNIDLRPFDGCETFIADVKDQEAMKELIVDADVVFHLASLIEAGESVKQPQRYIDDNISGTLNVLEAMRANGVASIVFSSSAAVYGEPTQTPLTEEAVTLPTNPYGMTKLAMEGLVSSYVATHGLTGVALRYFNLYGPGEDHQPETHAIPRFIKQIYDDESVTVWGDGGHQRDFVYIDDVVTAHVQALELLDKQPNRYHYYNLSTEQPATVLQIAQKIGHLLGKEPRIEHFPDRLGDPRVLYASAVKVRESLGWRATVFLDEGLEKTVEWFVERWRG